MKSKMIPIEYYKIQTYSKVGQVGVVITEFDSRMINFLGHYQILLVCICLKKQSEMPDGSN